VGVFDHVVASVVEAMGFGLREKFEKSGEKMGRKAPVTHPPDQADRMLAELRQSGLNPLEHGVAGWVVAQGKVEDKLLDGQAVLPGVVGG